MKKYKKGLWAAFAVAALASAFAFGGCTGTDTAHEHEWNDWRVTTPATCTTAGEKVRICKTDSTHKETEVIPATGHSYATGDNWTVDVAPTCQTKGSKSHHCTHDGCSEKADVTEMPVDPDAHKWAADWTVDKDPTCTEKGSQSHHCTVAGCTAKKDDTPVDIDPEAHEWADTWTVDVEPTCQTKGSKSHHCTHAGCNAKTDVTEVAVDPDAHEWATDWTVDVASTCVAKGSKSHHCLHTGCNEKHDVTEVDIDPDAHDFATGEDWTVDTPATCTADGSKSHHCKHAGCTAKKDDTVIAAGDGTHVYSEEFTVDKEPTCTEAGSKSHHCTKCDAKKDITEIGELGHDYATGDNWTVDKAATCTEAGSKSHHCSRCDSATDVTAIEIDPDAHAFATGDDWTVDKAATCTEAGSKSHHCTREGCDGKIDVTEIAALGHNPTAHPATESTCTVKGHDAYWECETCHKLFSDEALATEIDAVVEHDLVAHKYDYSKGSYHGKKDSTCFEDGYQAYYSCAVCEAKFSTNSTTLTTPLTDEEWEKDYVIKASHKSVTTRSKREATCTLDGYAETHYYCSKCKKSSMTKDFAVVLTDEEAAALLNTKLGHDYSEDWTVDKEPTCAIAGSKSHHCTRTGCTGKTGTTTIEKLPHTWSDDYSVDVAPTCSAVGSKSHHCSVCDASDTDSKVEIPIDPEAHGWSDFTIDVEPTCQKEGRKSKHCMYCDVTKDSTVVPADPDRHDYSTYWVVDTEATCTTGGSRSQVCLNEGCTAKRHTVETPALGHDFVWSITDGDADTPREGTRTCSRCNVDALKYTFPAVATGKQIDAAVAVQATGEHNSVKLGYTFVDNVSGTYYLDFAAPQAGIYLFEFEYFTTTINALQNLSIENVSVISSATLDRENSRASINSIQIELQKGDVLSINLNARAANGYYIMHTHLKEATKGTKLREGISHINITVANDVTGVDSYTFTSKEAKTYSLTVPEGMTVAMNNSDLISSGTWANFKTTANKAITFSFTYSVVGEYQVEIGEQRFMELDLFKQTDVTIQPSSTTNGYTDLYIADGTPEQEYVLEVTMNVSVRQYLTLAINNNDPQYVNQVLLSRFNGLSGTFINLFHVTENAPCADTVTGEKQASFELIRPYLHKITITLKAGDVISFASRTQATCSVRLVKADA